MTVAFAHPGRNPQLLSVKMQKFTALSGAANRSTNLWARSQGAPVAATKTPPEAPLGLRVGACSRASPNAG